MRKVKAWAIIDQYGNFQVACPNIPMAKYANESLGEGRKDILIPCTITYSIKKKRKPSRKERI